METYDSEFEQMLKESEEDYDWMDDLISRNAYELEHEKTGRWHKILAIIAIVAMIAVFIAISVHVYHIPVYKSPLSRIVP